MAVVTFTDNGDGTGGVFTVDGIGVSSINTVQVSRFHGSNASREFVPAGNRTGDGTIPYAGDLGAYIAIATSVDGSTMDVSPPICFRITDGTLSLYERVLVAVREFVMSLALPGIPTDPDKHVIAKMGAKLKQVWDTGSEGVYYIPTAEQISGADNAFATVSFPVNVVFMIKSGHNMFKGLSDLLIAREDANLSMSDSPLPDLPEIHTVNAIPGVVTDPAGWAQGMDVSVLQFVCIGEQIDGLL